MEKEYTIVVYDENKRIVSFRLKDEIIRAVMRKGKNFLLDILFQEKKLQVGYQRLLNLDLDILNENQLEELVERKDEMLTKNLDNNTIKSIKDDE